MIDDAGLARFVAENLPLAPARVVPEVRLHLARPSSGLHRLGLSRSPYWAYQWGGGTALARYILDHPDVVAGRRVLDLGCGGGLVAIAAAKAGAREISAVDVDPAAVVAARLAAQANGVAVAVRCANGFAGGAPPVDTVLVGDLFYAPRLAIQTTAFLARCLAAGLQVRIGDPGRPSLPRDRLRKLADVAVPDFGERGGQMASGAVYGFAAAPLLSAASDPAPW